MSAAQTPVRPSAVRPTAIRRKVEAWLAERDGAEAIALLAVPEWNGDPTMTVGDAVVRIVACPTPIAARAALADRAPHEKLVLLTDLTDAELGDGLLAHLSCQTARSVDAWDLVRQAFGGQVRLDARLVRGGRWIADAITDVTPPEGWPALPGNVLTREHALRALAAAVLGVSTDALDSAGLLQWSLQAPDQLRFIGLPATTADGIAGFLAELAGPAAVPVLAAVRAGHGVDAIALGLLGGVLWPGDGTTAPDVGLAVARTRLEPRFGGLRLTPDQATAFTAAAEAWVYRALEGEQVARREAARALLRAEQLAAELEISDRLASSTVLPSGFTQRMRAFAAAVRLALPPTGDAPPAPALLGRAEARLAQAQAHRSADDRKLETARMAVRLLRWLSTPDAMPATMLDALHRQVREDAWVDRARAHIVAGDVDPEVATAYEALRQAVDARRLRHQQQFAGMLQDTTAAEREPGALLRIEDVLDRVVRPILASGNRVLLLVLAGMSTADSTLLAESLTPAAVWTELTPDGGPRVGVLAALPTVADVNRASLFAGRVTVGGADDQREALLVRFPGACLLPRVSPPGGAVDRDLAAALAEPDTPLVAAVIDATNGEQNAVNPPRPAEAAGVVRELLTVAHDRVVVLMSDHGWVDARAEPVDRATDPGGDRWRTPAEAPYAGELIFSGSRVARGDGRIVLPWRDDLCYGSTRPAHSGGAAPAEAVIPLLVYTARDEHALPGWSGAPVASPAWWREPVSAPAGGPTPPEETAGPRARPAANRRPPAQEEGLFDLPDAASPPPPQETGVPALAEALLHSPVYVERRRGSRATIADERVAAMVGTLVVGNGRAALETLAVEAGIPAHRMRTTFSALRGLLQVEGYPVLDLDPDGRTAKLDIDLLIEQFGLPR